VDSEQFRQLIIKRFDTMYLIKKIPLDDSEYRKLNHRLFDLKKLTVHLNFSCKFQNGVCKRNFKEGCKNCCSRCYQSIGHLRTIQESDFYHIATLFTREDGFWEKDKGCLLSRAHRSILCVTFHCNENMNLHILTTLLREYENQLIEQYGQQIEREY